MSALAALRTKVHLNTTVTVVLVGTGTAWTPGTPGSPTFALAGGTGSSITGQVVNSATQATLTIATGSALGALTITDPSTSNTTKVYVVRVTRNKWFPGLTGRR